MSGALVFASTATDSQRQIFKRVYAEVELGNWAAVDSLDADERRSLEDYVLYPDLRAAWLRATLVNADHAEIDAFLGHHGVLKPARELRYRYALHLADIGYLDEYLAIYEQYYQGLDDERLDCLALQAELEVGRASRVVNRAIDLWTVGESQVDECDPVFEFLDDGDHLDIVDYMRRFELAIDAREFTMAQWLGKSIDQQHIDTAGQWLRAQRNPESFVENADKLDNNETTRDQLIFAIERITYDDPLRALELWTEISRGQRFSAEQELRTARHIALWMARDRLTGAYKQLTALPVAAQNAEVIRWRARTSLRLRNWPNLLADIEAMTATERGTEEWRYWYGIALQRNNRIAEGDAVLQQLAAERSYYGFLAADELGLPYSLVDESFSPDEQRIAELAGRPELIRARELFLVGLDGRGRSEWDAVVRYLEAGDKMQAAILANRWGWHSRAIAAAASVGDFDDLSLRYPLPFHETFREHSEAAGISTTWAYGVARSESLFMRDARSRAGAVGLMQLMPATGKEVARSIKLPYSGLSTLTDPGSNIRLGTFYLGQMADRYGGNRVLATAAYNAGPHRVDAWLPQVGNVDARVWIENIPFNETRGYVKRVLAAETIFHWRMTGQIRRLSDELLVVRAEPKPHRVARN
ncbi:MAG: transglycosylase SLT domain-containing protein [Woeseiaceae bacterium]|nr:transglycosylase SLT domain-containing protein [Woeseiaceae bacterium]NIP21275.1 transglycosylase SLT domain-containing protein [Woeseiaceae bacterium]